MLAIFAAGGDGRSACAKALTAVEAILKRVQAERAKASDAQRFDIKIALHLGEVAYGNIGSGVRLDYTVVGGDVNLASRLADLAGNLERHVLVSEGFAALLPDKAFEDRGEHSLRGVAKPQRVFEPAF